MLNAIPTHLIAGPLGAGKTSLLRHLLGQRPENERWALLINEFGELGIDAALLEQPESGVQIADIAGGCLCCVNGVPFQVGLSRLLRRARPDRLLIECSGLGHPATLQQQLQQPPWDRVLQLQPLIMVLDARQPLKLSPAQASALPQAGLLVLNRISDCSQPPQLPGELSNIEQLSCDHGALALTCLPQTAEKKPGAEPPPVLNASPAPLPLWQTQDDWHCLQRQQDGFHSIGWRLHPQLRVQRQALAQWLAEQHWLRAKGIFNTEAGWMSFNCLAPEPLHWRVSDWRNDNRLELISTVPLERQELEPGLRRLLHSQ